MRPTTRITTPVAAIIVVLAMCGCQKLRQDMYDQPKNDPLEASPLWSDGRASRSPMAGTVARSWGAFADASSGTKGAPIIIGAQTTGQLFPVRIARISGHTPRHTNENIPFPITLRFLMRGQERFDIYCSPCHSPAGDGDGMVVARGFPRPPSYHTDALRKAPLSHFYDVITHGYGIMYSYADRISPHDRWAIAAYIRALQLTRHASPDDAPAAKRRELTQVRR